MDEIAKDNRQAERLEAALDAGFNPAQLRNHGKWSRESDGAQGSGMLQLADLVSKGGQGATQTLSAGKKSKEEADPVPQKRKPAHKVTAEELRISRERHRPDPSAQPRIQAPGDPVPPSPPAYRKSDIPQSHWNEFHDQLSAMNIGNNARFALGATLAAEGTRVRDDGTSTAYGGILQETLDDARKVDPSLPVTPDELTPAQLAKVYCIYGDQNLSDIGGLKALDMISGTENAAVFWDLMFREGKHNGMSFIHDACKNVVDALSPEEKKALGSIGDLEADSHRVIFENYKQITKNPKLALEMLCAIRKLRDNKYDKDNQQGERDRNKHFSFGACE